ncbi:alpha/beta fold hydrolase [Clostridium sp. CS001]|uniref:alpha/beta hydrolase n=1 Tax=Clostridium sp. CS001 TaxID=2880648 RepID=UPI001CF1A761|nr:alpha/beta fold hydrolase [Clostridium sp. CS001]MCB2290869.1 alpha/beta fold hydrolase [Clostridium sp. CS001]
MKEVFINKDGIDARIHEWGDEENPTIICFHGLGSTSLSFIELGHLLKNKYHIIAIDLPGHGKTPPFEKEENYEMPNMISWVDKVISTITEHSFYLLAHSYGADIALHYLYTYPPKVIKTLLLDGGYYIKTELYAYRASRSESISSLQREIDYYISDFDDYCFDTLEEHIEVEKSNYIRWSNLLEEASADLIRIENDKYRWHANGFTATGAIKSMYHYPPNSIYDKLPKSIYLLQSTLPESMIEIREILVEKFCNGTNSRIKRIEGASHLLHWDKPNEVVKEVLYWFK